jgi:copper(I)-binding protein
MNKITRTGLLALAAAMLTAFALAGCGSTNDETPAAGVTIKDPWARVTAPKQMMGAAYMTISSAAGDKLVKVTVPSTVADHAELHEVVMAGGGSSSQMGDAHMNGSGGGSTGMSGAAGKMTMKQVSSITIPAGGSVSLKPGGYHVMLIDLKKPIVAGDEIDLTLTFEKAGEQKVVAVAKD